MKRTKTGHEYPPFLTELAHTSTPDSGNTPNNTTTDTNNQDTLADIPSLSDDISLSSVKCKNDTDGQRAVTYRKHGTTLSWKYVTSMESLSPGEVPNVLLQNNYDVNIQSLSKGEVPTVRNIPQMTCGSDSEPFSFDNKVRNGIDVIDISHKNDKVISNSSNTSISGQLTSPCNTHIKNKIIISSEEPQTPKYTLQSTLKSKPEMQRFTSPGPIKKHQGPVILMDKSDKESDYSFTFSSLSIPLPN